MNETGIGRKLFFGNSFFSFWKNPVKGLQVLSLSAGKGKVHRLFTIEAVFSILFQQTDDKICSVPGNRSNKNRRNAMIQKKKRRIWRNILIDLGCTGIALVVFALFHHVLPRQQESIGIVSVVQAEAETEEKTEENVQASEEPDATAAPTAEPEKERKSGSAGGRNRSAAAPRKSSSGRSGAGGWKSSRSGGGTERTMNAKGGSALSQSDVESTGEVSGTALSEKFADRYSDTVVVTEQSYTSPDISITVSEETLDDGKITYYLADIYVRDITCFQTTLAEDTYGTGYRDSIEEMASEGNALLAVNGDYYGNTTEGVVVRNGVIYRANPTDCDVCVLYQDGTMQVMPGSAFSVEEAVAEGAWQAWTFGPALLDADGSVLTSFASSSRIISANPRTAIGYYEPGHYCLVVVDGRGESAGITLQRLSELFNSLGCKAAYNLDGGKSSIMVWQDEIINTPSGGGRESSDALLIAEVKNHD